MLEWLESTSDADALDADALQCRRRSRMPTLSNYNGFDLLDEQIVASVEQISMENLSEIIRNNSVAIVDQSQWYTPIKLVIFF